MGVRKRGVSSKDIVAKRMKIKAEITKRGGRFSLNLSFRRPRLPVNITIISSMVSAPCEKSGTLIN